MPLYFLDDVAKRHLSNEVTPKCHSIFEKSDCHNTPLYFIMTWQNATLVMRLDQNATLFSKVIMV